jgi:Lon-like protease
VPYVILEPGPTLNTLGQDSSGQPLITISGHKTYPTSGNLNMVTVSYEGGPGVNVNIFQALRAWLDPSQAVVPEGELFPPGQSAEQTQQQDTEQMASSQETATAAAFTELHIPYQTQVVVMETVPGLPANTVLKAGDQILAVDGKPVTGQSDLSTLITAHPAGSVLQLTVLRAGNTLHLAVKSQNVDGTAVIGVQVQEEYKFPFNVKISVGAIGGPSAGMMFALGIIDKLTPMNLTGGKFIAGTGEITPSGQVQPIGGIQQKMVGARDAGATIFLTPASNCSDTVGAVPAGLRIVKVSTLTQAIDDLEAIKAGKPVPSC